MTKPQLAYNVRGRGRNYPFPPTDLSDLPLNRWGSLDPETIPDDVTMLPSVTNILGDALAKHGLLYWSSEQSIRAGYQDGWPADVEEAVSRYKGAFRKARDKRADAGTRAHTLAERLTTDQPLPSSVSDEDAAFADAFMQFWADHDPYPIFVEATVANPKYGYAGTADLFADIDGKTVVLDYKTRGEPPKKKKRSVLYDENRAQLAALAEAYWRYEFKDGKWRSFPVPWVDEGWGVVLYPDGTYDTEVLDADELARCFEGFKGCIQTWTWLKGAAA